MLKSPVVIVPVLSKTMCFALAKISRLCPPFIRIPFRAARLIPTITAVGVANPIAQGQEITNTAIAFKMAILKSTPMTKYHTTKVKTEMPTTIGTNIPATLSPNF